MKSVKSSTDKEINALKIDIAKCESFTEEQMQEHFNTDDSKEEFLQILREDLNFYENLKEEEEKESRLAPLVDEGFADMDDYINYKYL